MKDTSIIFDFLKLQEAARYQLNEILACFPDLEETIKILAADPSNTETPETSAEAQAVIERQMRLCGEVIEALETRQRTLHSEKELKSNLGHILSEIQTRLNPDEPLRILTSLYDAANIAVDYARDNIQLQEKQQVLLTNFESQLNNELGRLKEMVNIQRLIASSRDELNSLLRSEIEELNDDINRQIRNAQLASDQIFNKLTEELNDDFLYYALIKTSRAYLEMVPDPDAQIERVNQLWKALELWKEEYDAWVALLANDSIYQELLAQPTVVDDIDPKDLHRLGCLFGKNGTSLEARLGLLEERTPEEAYNAAFEEYTDAYERWFGEIHFLGGDQRAIVEHGCRWIDRIQDVWKGARS